MGRPYIDRVIERVGPMALSDQMVVVAVVNHETPRLKL